MHLPTAGRQTTLSFFLQNWIDSLSVPKPEFSGSPACPYAARAGISVFTIHTQAGLNQFLSHLNEVLPRCVLILRVEPHLHAPPHSDRQWVALESNPQEPVIVQGFRTTHQGTTKLILVQNRKELYEYREVLMRQGYFKHWDPADLRKIGA